MAEEPRGERLQKILSRAGVASRRAAEDLIRAGRVTIGDRVAVLGDRVGERGRGTETVRVDGDPIAQTATALRPAEQAGRPRNDP